MDAFLAMQIHSVLLLSLVVIAFMFRLIIKQLSYSLHYKWLYEHRINLRFKEINEMSNERVESAYRRLLSE